MPFWFDSGVASDATIAAAIGTAYGKDVTGTAADSYYATGNSRDQFNFQFFIAHPTTANLFDGFNGVAWASVKTTDGSSTKTNVVVRALPIQQVTFQDMRSQIEEKIDDLIFKSFKVKTYDPKEA